MRYVNFLTGAAVLSGVLAIGATMANAEAAANFPQCLQMANQVKGALANNSQSPNYQEAVKQQGYGRDFCLNGLYQNGVARYSEALKLLGADKS